VAVASALGLPRGGKGSQWSSKGYVGAIVARPQRLSIAEATHFCFGSPVLDGLDISSAIRFQVWGLKPRAASVARGLRSGVKPLKILGSLTDLMAPKHPLLPQMEEYGFARAYGTKILGSPSLTLRTKVPSLSAGGGYGFREGPMEPKIELLTFPNTAVAGHLAQRTSPTKGRGH
jgi:hypothetical protein